MSEPESKNHWKQLAEQLGADAPEPTPPPAPRTADTVGERQPAPAKKAAPHKAEPKRDRSHWAGLAGQLGIDFPDPPPAPQPAPEQVTSARTKPDSAEEDAEAEQFAGREFADEAHKDDAHQADEEPQGTVYAVPPEGLVEDSASSASDMLDEISDVDMFDAAGDDAGDGLEEADEEAVAQRKPPLREDRGSSRAAKEDTAEESEEGEGTDQPRRGRRRRGRRRRKDGQDDRPRDQDSQRGETADDADEDDVDDDSPSPGRRSRSSGTDKPRKFPTWNEAIEILISRNQESRKSSGGGGGRRGGGGGGGGRGRRRRPTG